MKATSRLSTDLRPRGQLRKLPENRMAAFQHFLAGTGRSGTGPLPAAPDIQRAIIDGRQPRGLTLAQLMRIDMPLDWKAQREAFV